MTKLAVPSGVPLASANRRLGLSSYGLARTNNEGAAGGTSLRARATATASGTPHTKGAYTQAIAATTVDCNMLWVGLTASTGVNATDTALLLDVAIGAAASEVVIVPNLALGCKAGSNGLNTVTPYYYAVPVHIPVGSRVAIACQSAVASASAAVELVLGNLPQSRQAPDKVVAIGANTATSKGVSVAASGSTNTKSAWVDITTSTPQPLAAVAVGCQADGDTVLPGGNGLLDIGISVDGGTTYTAISGGADLPIGFGNSLETVGWSVPMLIPCVVPMGVRLAARWQATATGNSLDVIAYGVPA